MPVTISNKRACGTVETCTHSISLSICDVKATGLPLASGVRCLIEIDGKEAILNFHQLGMLMQAVRRTCASERINCSQTVGLQHSSSSDINPTFKKD